MLPFEDTLPFETLPFEEEEPKKKLKLTEVSPEQTGEALTGIGRGFVSGLGDMATMSIAGLAGPVKSMFTGKPAAEEIGNVQRAISEATPSFPESESMAKTKQVLALPSEVAHMGGEKLFEATGSPLLAAGAETLANAAMFALPAGKGKTTKVQAISEVLKKPAEEQTPAQRAVASLEQPKVEFTPEGQGILPFEKTTEGLATPYEAGQMGITEPVAPLRARRQMELPFGEETGPLTADIQGQIFRGDVTSPEARLGLQEAERATAQELKKGTILEHPEGEPLPYLQAPELPFNIRRQGGAINPEVFKEGFEKVKEAVNGVRLRAQTLFVNELQITALNSKGDEIGRAVFEPTNNGIKEQDARSFITKVAPESQRQGIATELYKFAAELGNDISPDSIQTPNGKAMWEGFQKKGLAEQGRIRKQGGGIRFDFSKKPEVDKLMENKALAKVFPELTRVAETPEEVAALAKVSTDVERGLVGKALGQFTKGMLYEKFKTDNPILKYTYDVISDAIDAASYTVYTLIQKQLSPSLRKLSKQEMGELGDVLVAAMKNKKELTPEFLREHGFSENQIAASETLKKVHEENLRSLNESRRLAGKSPVEAYEGYIAGLASGNFRRLIYKEGPEGEQVVVGIVGSDFRNVMNSRVEALLAEHPDWKAMPEKYTGISKRKQDSTKALTDALAILSDNNPNFAEFAKAMDDLITGETYRSLGAKKHTMGKKGIIGMMGDKPWQDSYNNAVDLFNAQIRYTDTMAKWSEFSKAMDKLAVVFKDPEVQAKQPNALKMADDYVKNAMGQNPSKVGQAIDGLIGAVGDQVGVGPAVLRHTIKLARNTVNALFFILNHAWMAVNLAQPTLVMPETKAFLRGRGIELNLDPTGVSDLLSKGSYSSLKHIAGWKETPFEQAMWKFAKEHGIDQTRLIDSNSAIQAGPKYMISRGMKLGANAVEAGPRSVMFATMSHLLEQSGYGKDPDIFPVARQLTDMAMGDYRHHEQIRASQHLGSLGEMSANLTSFKQNTLSRYALFARELGKGNAGAFSTAMIAALTYAGVMGFPGFTEADSIVEHLSKMMGKPTTLTKLILDMATNLNSEHHSKVGDMLAMGAGAYYGVDLHNRVGMPSIAPSLTGGAGKLVDIIKEGADFVSKPNEWNAKQFARQIAPPPLQPWMDVSWFTKETSMGEQIALNKQGKGTVMRTEKDKLFKKLGFTGSSEAKGKALDYATSQQDKYYTDAQKKVTEQIQEVMAANHGSIPEAQLMGLMKDYVDAQGDPNAFVKSLETAGVNLNTTTRARRILASQGTSLAATRRLERTPKQ